MRLLLNLKDFSDLGLSVDDDEKGGDHLADTHCDHVLENLGLSHLILVVQVSWVALLWFRSAGLFRVCCSHNRV